MAAQKRQGSLALVAGLSILPTILLVAGFLAWRGTASSEPGSWVPLSAMDGKERAMPTLGPVHVPTEEEWREFLTEWSRMLLEDEQIRTELPAKVVDSEWLGYPGATEGEIAAVEERLGTRLPPSYRSFLKVSNGWRTNGAFIYKMWPIEDLEWFRVRNQQWIDAYTEPMGGYPSPSDAVYFNYGEDQDTVSMRLEYLPSLLEISDVGDDAIMLLNPEVVTSEGEWEAWFFANWYPGAARYRSFWEMMQAEYRGFPELSQVPR